MKTPAKTAPETGPKYWRSLDELSGSTEFQNWLHREFPVGASESDGQSRREFVKVMGASFLLGGLMTGCRRPVETIEPFTRLPEGYIHGGSQFYATSMPTRSGALPLVVRATDGRPVKIEGNDKYPNWNGGSSLHAQSSILDLYDPDRSTRFMQGTATATRGDALGFLDQLARHFSGNGGQGLAILADRNHSPSRERLQKAIAQKYPQSKWFVFEATEAPQLSADVRPVYHFEKAARILSLDSDFLGDEDESHRSLRGYAQGRKIAKPGDAMSRLYVVEALMTLTGGAADHRLRKAASEIPDVARQLAEAIVNGGASQDKWIAECAKDLLANKGKAVVVAGYRQPQAVHALAMAMNAALDASGNTVTWLPKPKVQEGTIQQLVETLNTGSVEALVILGGNPAYNAPADLNFAEAAKKAKQVVRLGYHADETSALATWHLAEAHYLESWGDTRTVDGIVCAVQPLIAPLFGGVTQCEVLARLAGLPQTSGYDITRETVRGILGQGNFEAQWKDFLHDGFLKEADVKPTTATLNAGQLLQSAGQIAKSAGGIEVVIYRCGKVGDGRYANNGWLQELPETISKLSWDNAVFMSRKTANDLGISFETLKNQAAATTVQDINQRETAALMVPLVKITVGGKDVTGPAWIMPGLADNTVAIAMGYGREKIGRVGAKVGFNANPLRTSASPFLATGAKVSVAGGTHQLALTQEHWAMEGRPIVREANLETFEKHPDFAKSLNLEEPPGGMRPLYPNPLAEKSKGALHQWGMAIDMNACVGCNACVIACQSENNVPIVGKRQVANGREMHWLRIDRYFTGTVADPQLAVQPMLCQHCEAAPCENVCPVNATVHDQEGLNVMAYNRCVGTRYCSNNCPYKVRRFNYFDYNKRDLNRLYEIPLNPANKRPDGTSELISWFKSPESGNKPNDEWELMKLVRNPDVSVRMRGVMEKCTYCTQRIESAKIAQKVKAKASGDVVVPDGTFTTACAQACPADAIVFGNIADPNSKVSEAKRNVRTYKVLEFLHTLPRTTYAARVRNPNTAMPDYKEYPHSLQEYSDAMGDPFKGHGGGHGGDHAAGDAQNHAPGEHGAQAPAHGTATNSESMKKGAH